MLADYLSKMNMPWDYWLEIILSIGGILFLIICKIYNIVLIGEK